MHRSNIVGVYFRRIVSADSGLPMLMIGEDGAITVLKDVFSLITNARKSLFNPFSDFDIAISRRMRLIPPPKPLSCRPSSPHRHRNASSAPRAALRLPPRVHRHSLPVRPTSPHRAPRLAHRPRPATRPKTEQCGKVSQWSFEPLFAVGLDS